MANGVTVAVITLALVGFELGYRRVRGSSGMGMGDIKALVPLMVVNPSCALIAFAVGLLALALAGLSSAPACAPVPPIPYPRLAPDGLFGDVFRLTHLAPPSVRGRLGTGSF